MIIDAMVRNPVCWLSMSRDTGIVISSRVRLARNVRPYAFPGWAGEGESARLCSRLRGIVSELKAIPDPVFVDMGSVGPLDREILKERQLISNELADRGAGSGLIVSADEAVAIMINEEDHLRLQAIVPGQHLKKVWKIVDAVDSEIEEHLDFAFDARWGYLTACPTNVGTGLRASVLMHLIGLQLLNEVQAVVNGLEKMGLAVRGMLGEGTEASGSMFQISNQSTLGQSEDEIIRGLTRIVAEVATHEENARLRLIETRRSQLLDHIGRSFGVLTHAHVLTSKEAVDYLSALRLGVHLGFVSNVKVRNINEIMLLTQPGHLQKIWGRSLGVEERDEVRAEMVRTRMENIELEF